MGLKIMTLNVCGMKMIIEVDGHAVCPVCTTPMEFGKAIDPLGRSNFGVVSWPLITHNKLKIIDVWKCPKCGHSEFLEDDRRY
jgi:rubredoxin